MTIDELKRALVEVRDMCRKTKCIKCPLRKTEEVPYCPLHEDEYGIIFEYPAAWDIDDWKEEAQDATQGTDQAE